MAARRCNHAILSLAAIAALLPAAAGAWVVAQTSGRAAAGVVDSAGDVYTVGGSRGAEFVVTKLAGESGKRRWAHGWDDRRRERAAGKIVVRLAARDALRLGSHRGMA